MKLITLISISIVAFASFVQAQAINFAVEKNNLFFADGSVAGRNADNSIDNRDQINVFAGFTSGDSKTAFEAGISNYLNDADIAGLNTTLGQVTWVSVPNAAGLLAGSRDFNLSGETGAIGSSPLLLVTTASSFNNLGASDEVGLVTTTVLVPELGTITVGFNQASSWNTAYIGTLGSLQLASVVPEPSTYAALAGLLALGFVMVRRRK